MAQPTPPASQSTTPAPASIAPSNTSNSALSPPPPAENDDRPADRSGDGGDVGMTADNVEPFNLATKGDAAAMGTEEISGDEDEDGSTDDEEEEDIEVSSEDEGMDAMRQAGEADLEFDEAQPAEIGMTEDLKALDNMEPATRDTFMQIAGGTAAEGAVLASGGDRRKRGRKGKGKARADASSAQALGGGSELSIGSTAAEGGKAKRTKQKAGGAGREGGGGRGDRGGKKEQDVWESDIVQAWNKEFGDVCKVATASTPARA